MDYTIYMVSSRLRLTFLVVGLVMILISLVFLAYALWPAEVLQAQATLAPTIFAPP